MNRSSLKLINQNNLVATWFLSIPLIWFITGLIAMPRKQGIIQDPISVALYIMGFSSIFILFLFVLRYKISFDSHIIIYPIVIMSVLAIISTINSINFSVSISGTHLRNEGVFALIAYYGLFLLAGLISIRSSRARFLIALSFIFYGFFQGLYAMGQHYQLSDFFISNYGIRSGGLVGNPNFFGSYLVLLSGLTITGAALVAKRYISILLSVLTLYFFIMAIYSHTLSSWLGILSIYIILFSVFLATNIKSAVNKNSLCPESKKQKPLRIIFDKKMIRLITLGLLSILVFFVINYLEGQRYLGKMNKAFSDVDQFIQSGAIPDSMGSNRGLIWRLVVNIIPDYWKTGTGVDALEYAMMRLPIEHYQQPQGFNPARIDKAHNEVLHIAITQGIPAAITYLVWLGLVIKNGIKRVKQSKLFSRDPDSEADPNAWVWLALLMAVVGYFVQSNFNISVVTVAPYFWIFAGLLCPYPWDEKSLVKRDLGNSFKLVRKNKNKSAS